jgi:PAS domain S-box-containing protein
MTSLGSASRYQSPKSTDRTIEESAGTVAAATILIVDDQAEIRQFLRTLLGLHGHQVIEAVEPWEGLRAAAENHPDLIITDIVLPTIDGYEFVRRLRLHASTCRIPVIVLTAVYQEEEQRVMSQACGVSHFLTKPIQPAVLLAAVNDALASSPPSAPPPRSPAFEQDHLRLVSTKLQQQLANLERVNEKLSENEERFRQLAENIQQFFWLNSPDGKVLYYASPAYERIFGRSLASLLTNPESWLDAVHPEDRERVRAASLASIREDPVAMLYRVVRPTGAYRWIWSRAFPVRNERGEVYRIAGIAEDVTERRQAEEARSHLAFLIESTDDAVIGSTLDGTVVSWNPAAEAMYGYSSHEMIGKPVGLLMPAEAGDELPCILEKLANGEVLAHHETVQIRKDGRRINVSLTLSSIEDAWGTIIGVSAISRDITERKRAEEALRERETRLRLLVEQMPNLLWSTEVALRVSYIAGAGLAKLGIQPDKLIGRTLAEILHTDDPESRPLAAHRLALGGKPQDYETEWLGRTFRVYVEPLRNAEGTILGCIGVALDITERKKAEQELEHLSRRLLEVQEGERRALARELHDEFGQLLTALQLSLEASARAPAAAFQEKLGDCQSLVWELLSRVRKLSVDLRPAMLDDLGLVATLSWHCEQFQTRTGISVTFRNEGLTRRFPGPMESAAYRIVQEGLTNVARHAQARSAAVLLWSDAKSLTLRIEDQGVGFDPGTKLALGSSSGLLGMRERATLLGGRLTIESQPGSGTRLQATIPLPHGEEEPS